MVADGDVVAVALAAGLANAASVAVVGAAVVVHAHYFVGSFVDC